MSGSSKSVIRGLEYMPWPSLEAACRTKNLGGGVLVPRALPQDGLTPCMSLREIRVIDVEEADGPSPVDDFALG